MPEQIANPDGVWVDATIIYQTTGYDQVAESMRVDGAANTHLASLWSHGNCTVVYYRIINVAGAVIGKYNIVMQGTPHTLDPAMSGKPKTVDFDMAPSGRDMVFSLGGHLADPTHSQNPVAVGRIPGVYVPVVSASPEDGKAGSFQPVEGEPEPGGGGVTEDQLRAILRDELGLRDGENDLIGQFAANAPTGQSTVRKGLHETGVGDTKKAEIELLTGNPETDPQARQYQDALFAFVKNASANPWANVLGGQDAWGQARQEELRQIIREELAAAQTATPKAKKESPAVGSGPKD